MKNSSMDYDTEFEMFIQHYYFCLLFSNFVVLKMFNYLFSEAGVVFDTPRNTLFEIIIISLSKISFLFYFASLF